jgi:serine protease inhibitor
MTSLTLDLLDRAGASTPDMNVALSPLAIASALAVTGHATRGATGREFDKLLGLPVQDNPRAAARSLVTGTARAAETGSILLRNAVWLPAALPVNPWFAPGPFEARLTLLPRDAHQAVAAINAWIAEATHGAIGEMVATPLDTSGVLVTSAAYFKGRWRHPFNTADTRLEDFLARGGTPCKVSMMHQTDIEAAYWSRGDLEAIRLPFLGGPCHPDYVIVTSRSRAPAEEILETIRERALAEELTSGRGFELRCGTIAIPRHRVEFATELSPALRQLGLHVAFSSAADFTALTPAPLFLQGVRHRALLVVDEAGAEASGGTAAVVTLGLDTSEPLPPLNFIADRPFVSLLVAWDAPQWPVMVALVRSP